MSCFTEDQIDLLAYDDGSASDDEHLQTCATCRQSVELARTFVVQSRKLYQADAEAPVDQVAKARLLQQITTDSRNVRFRYRELLAACVIFALSGGAFAYIALDASTSKQRERSEHTSALMEFSAPAQIEWKVSTSPIRPVVASKPELKAQRAQTKVASARRVSKGEMPRGQAGEIGATALGGGRTSAGKTVRVATVVGPTAHEVSTKMLLSVEGEPEGSPKFVEAGQLAALAGDAPGAAGAFVRGLAGPQGAAAASMLDEIVDSGAMSQTEVETLISADAVARSSAMGLKLMCRWGLSRMASVRDVDTCIDFVEAAPGARETRQFAMRAGRAAESKLNDLERAERLYTLTLAATHGRTGTLHAQALIARTRIYVAQGKRGRALADLRLCLERYPELARRDDILTLKEATGFDDAVAAVQAGMEQVVGSDVSNAD